MDMPPRPISEYPPIGEDSFLFGDNNILETECNRPERPQPPLSVASQARTLEWALEAARDTHTDPIASANIAYAQHLAHNMAQITLVANTSESAAVVEEMKPDPRCQTVVFKDGGRVVIGPSLEAETAAIIDLSILDVRAVQRSYEKAATIPESQIKGGGGAEILDALPESAKVVAIDALRAMLVARRPSDTLLTHTQAGANTAGDYFAEEASAILRSAGYSTLPNTSPGRFAETAQRAVRIPRVMRRVSAMAMTALHLR